MSFWDSLVDEAVAKLQSSQRLLPQRAIHLPNLQPPKITENKTQSCPESYQEQLGNEAFQVYDKIQPWDRSAVEVQILEETFRRWIHHLPSTGGEAYRTDEVKDNEEKARPQQYRKLLLFSGNDYLGLSSHPTIGKAAAKAAREHGMGPRGSPLICGYTNYHRLLESSLADLKKKEDCLLCPTGFAANMALLVAMGSINEIMATGRKLLEEDKVAIFSDSLNHASIIDGILLAERQRSVEVFIYRHCDMSHLDKLLSKCQMKKKVVVTDGLFSMDGDFAPMAELVKLRKKYQFLLVVDEAHGTFVCGKNGGGVAEEFNCEGNVDICVGTLSKAAGCHGGFIACSNKWKLLIQSRGRSFIFSTAMPLPSVAAAYAASIVARKETWRRRELWNRVREFQDLTGIPITSPVISLVVGTEQKALQASRHMFMSGFHVTPVGPPAVPPNSCRLRVVLSAAHTADDMKKLATALSQCLDLKEVASRVPGRSARL